MRYYKRRVTSIEVISINKINDGIKSIERDLKSAEVVGDELTTAFNILEKENIGMYEELFLKYCKVRLLKESLIN